MPYKFSEFVEYKTLKEAQDAYKQWGDIAEYADRALTTANAAFVWHTKTQQMLVFHSYVPEEDEDPIKDEFEELTERLEYQLAGANKEKENAKNQAAQFMDSLERGLGGFSHSGRLGNFRQA